MTFLVTPLAPLAWLIPGIVGLIVLALAVIIYNGLVNLKNDCDKAWSNIDVLLKQRYDEIPNLVRVCQAYMAHERETLLETTRAREAGLSAKDPVEACEAAGRAGQAVASLFATAESYPDLKANEQFLRLQKRISGIESEIADRREYFNACVNNYNIRIEQLPDTLVARFLGYRPRPLLRLRFLSPAS